MSRSSVLQPLGGPLAGQALEFPGEDVVIGSAPDCEVRIDVAGVHAYHARIVIDENGATLYGIEGIVGINDDKILAQGQLNSGDFVWIGEPGAEGSLMFQFTLGDASSRAAASSPDEDSELVHDLMEELEPQDVSFPVDEMESLLVQESIDAPSAAEVSPDLDLLDIEPEPLALAPLPEPDPFPAPVMPAPRSLSSSGAFKPPAPWQTAAAPQEAPAEVEYASAWESKPAAPPAPEVEEVHEEFDEPPADPEPPLPPPPPPPAPRPAAPRPAGPQTSAPRKQTTSPNLRLKTKVPSDAELAALIVPSPHRPERTTSSTGVIVGGLITLIVLGIGISWVVNSTPPVEAPPSVPGSVTMPPRPANTMVPPVTEAPPVTEGPAVVAEPVAPVTAPRSNPPASGPAATSPVTAAPQTQPVVKGGTAPVASAPPAAAPASPAARFLQEATTALATGDLARAGQLLDQAARLEPGNAEIGARKAEVDARLSILARRFSPGATAILGGRATKGPSGFDLGGGTATKTDYAAQIRCGVTPASVEPGLAYTARCSIVNIGQKPFRLESVTATEAADGARSAFAGTAPPRDLAPQGEAMILERTGTWAARSQWSLEVVAKTNREESFKVAHTWR